MTQDNDNGEQSNRVAGSRRDVLKGAGLAGLLALGSGTASAQTGVGGGPPSDELAHLQVNVYSGGWDERPDPGVAGRYFRVDDQDHDEHGAIYEDTGDQWLKLDLGVSKLHSQSVSTDEGRIKTNESVVGSLTRKYHGYAVKDDGTIFATHDDGSQFVLYKSADPTNGFEKVHEFGAYSASGSKRGLHITANGTLLFGGDEQIRRSTDDGETWSSVLSLPSGSQIWDFTEDSNGNILASESANVQIYKSTDDGASWSSFATSTELGNFPDHIHSIAYHPANDYIIVTGGDGMSTDGYYRSTDQGSTWDFYEVPNYQITGIGVHPTDGSTYFLAADESGSQGPVFKVSDDGASITYTPVLYTDLADHSDAQGGLDLLTVDDPNGQSFYVTSSINQSPNRLYTSQTLTGFNWGVAGYLDGGLFSEFTMAQAPYEQVLDPTVSRTVVTQGRFVDVLNAHDEVYSSQAAGAVDQRPVQNNIKFRGHGKLEYNWNLIGDSFVPWTFNADSGSRLRGLFDGGTFKWENADSGQNLLEYNTGADVVDLKTSMWVRQALKFINAENLSGTTGDYFDLRVDDGTNTTHGGPDLCMWIDANNHWRQVGTTNTFS